MEVTAATTNAEAAKTHVVTEATRPKKQETTKNTTKTTARQKTAATANVLAPERTATTNSPKKTEKEVKQQLQVQPRESKQKTQSGTGSRTHDRETRTNVVANKERRNVNRQLTKVRTDWEEFKLLSFNVRGLNSESKQKVVDELVSRNRP